MIRRSTRSPIAPASIRTRSPGACRTALATMFATARSSRAGSASMSGRSSGTATSMSTVGIERLANAATTTSSQPTGTAQDPQRAALQPAHVEEVADQAVEPIGLLVDGQQELLGGIGRPRHVPLHQAGDRGLDRRERCAKIMGHRAEQGGPQCVGLAEQRGRGCLGLQPATIERRRELGGERLQHPLVVSAASGGPTSARRAVVVRGSRGCQPRGRRPAPARRRGLR